VNSRLRSFVNRIKRPQQNAERSACNRPRAELSHWLRHAVKSRLNRSWRCSGLPCGKTVPHLQSWPRWVLKTVITSPRAARQGFPCRSARSNCWLFASCGPLRLRKAPPAVLGRLIGTLTGDSCRTQQDRTFWLMPSDSVRDALLHGSDHMPGQIPE